MQSTYFRFGKDSDAQLYALVDDKVGALSREAEGRAVDHVISVADKIPTGTKFDAVLYEDGRIMLTRMSDPVTEEVASSRDTHAMAQHLGVEFLEGFNGVDTRGSNR